MSVLSLRFSRAFETYEEWALPQRKSADLLLSMKRVEGLSLDVGCGTGFASRGLKKVVGVDISKGMAKIYKDRFGKVLLANAEALPFQDKQFHLVISNFSLHWTNLKKSIPEMVRVCRGQMLIALPVEGSLKELGFPFPSESAVLNLVKSEGVKVLESFMQKLEIPFKGWDLLRFFHYTGTSFNPSKEGVIMSRKKIEDMISHIDTPLFSVLFLSCEVKA
ncbi:Methyltransferase type 11 [Hydrogenobacter thermophilus TK-6]|uniref:Biotin biosynthesis protein n=1 Tax=Hydrogenobacter thermophilus (strain DSM 6534 / IAM 12695 / TK-6) TaxID=608538 RepID=D3DKF0_HYDTT|nr:methyltransferase domain-containing protein [Hydrogenobacter thermophilus]ADO46222.1 Methyltransferase type 11 [Hydrogenobacter thermophilus TK-6]BAI70302.1 biotin biosynthesis protein [Hydrogenobacter thermophilus TK-6]